MASSDTVKITLLDDVLTPKEGTRESVSTPAGETIEVDKATADRLIELGKAAKPNSSEAKAAKADDDDDA